MATPILVILPGWAGSHETWRDFLNVAKNSGLDARCIDLPCFGDTPCPPHVWGVEEYAMFVRDQIERIQVSDPGAAIHLLGHSFGGQVAVMVAAKYGELLTTLILSGAAVFRPKHVLRRVILGVVAKTGKLLFRLPVLEKFSATAKKMLYRSIDSPDYTKTAGIKRDIFKKIIRQDVSLYLPGIRVKSLVLWGSKDSYVPLSFGKQIARALPKATLEVFPGAGHGLHLTHARQVIQKIQRFITQ